LRRRRTARILRISCKAFFDLNKGKSTMPDPKLKNVFEAILKYGHDEDFAPRMDEDFKATQAPAGSREKLDVLAERIRSGQPLWHEEDRSDYSGLTGAVRPRD